MEPNVEISRDRLDIIRETLRDFSRTEWDGLDDERLLILLDQKQHPTSNTDLYTLEEVADILSMSVVTIRQYVRMNKLKAIKVWRNWMVNSNEIARLMYEKITGKSVNSRTTMFTIIDASVTEDDMSIIPINKYKFLTPEDVADISGETFNSTKINAYQNLFENTPVGTKFIEIVSNIPNFFRKTGDIPFRNEEKEQLQLSNYQVKQDITDKILQEASYLIDSETPRKDLEELFGEVNNKGVIWKIYRTMLAFAVKYEKQLYVVDSLKSDIKELECKIKR